MGRAARAACRTSVKPAVVTSAVRAPVRMMTVLVAMVVPILMSLMSRGLAPTASIPASIPSMKSGGVDAVFAISTAPLTVSCRITSVNVPPTSTASTKRAPEAALLMRPHAVASWC